MNIKLLMHLRSFISPLVHQMIFSKIYCVYMRKRDRMRKDRRGRERISLFKKWAKIYRFLEAGIHYFPNLYL